MLVTATSGDGDHTSHTKNMQKIAPSTIIDVVYVVPRDTHTKDEMWLCSCVQYSPKGCRRAGRMRAVCMYTRMYLLVLFRRVTVT